MWVIHSYIQHTFLGCLWCNREGFKPEINKDKLCHSQPLELQTLLLYDCDLSKVRGPCLWCSLHTPSAQHRNYTEVFNRYLLDGWIFVWNDEQVYGWVNVCMAGRIDGRMNGKKREGRTDGQVILYLFDTHYCRCTFTLSAKMVGWLFQSGTGALNSPPCNILGQKSCPGEGMAENGWPVSRANWAGNSLQFVQSQEAPL